MGAAKAYLFRVLSHSGQAVSFSEEFKYDLPQDLKYRAVVAGIIGGILFFIVAIVLSVCTVKICNKRRRRKHDQGKLELLFICLCLCDEERALWASVLMTYLFTMFVVAVNEIKRQAEALKQPPTPVPAQTPPSRFTQ